jgi:hypothetical protein
MGKTREPDDGSLFFGVDGRAVVTVAANSCQVFA